MSPKDSSTCRGSTTRRDGEAHPSGIQWALRIRWLYPEPSHPSTWLAQSPISIGRGEDCDTQLPGSEISRRHAELTCTDRVWSVRDLSSTNGIRVNGSRVMSCVLSIGDVIRLGDWIGLVDRGDQSSSEAVDEFGQEHGMVYGPSSRGALSLAWRAATSDLPLVVEGETGTGKELVVRAVHGLSCRQGPLLAINCAALPEGLAEAELFGHSRGAFTGADRANLGFFRAAERGTLFLDEIADLPLTLQAKLLRALEAREVIPVGESLPIKVDVRIIAATQVPLRDKVRNQSFRADLAARLEGVRVVLPPLRRRIEEVPYLFCWFLSKHTGGNPPKVDPRLIERLCLHDWPANVRELELLARHLIGLYPTEPCLGCHHLPAQLGQAVAARLGQTATSSIPGQGGRDAEDFSRLSWELRKHSGNLARAASEAGISRRRAYRLLEQHPELDPKQLRRRSPGAKKGVGA
jgi:DNA-binding NtrC family response regulator